MSYKIDYLKDKKIVQVVVQGRVNFKIVRQYSIDAIKLSRGNNCKKFLINHSKTLLESGVYRLHTDGDTLEQFGFDPGDKIAIVISNDKNDSHLFDTTGSNINWSNFKYFNNVENAVRWLIEDE